MHNALTTNRCAVVLESFADGDGHAGLGPIL